LPGERRICPATSDGFIRALRTQDSTPQFCGCSETFIFLGRNFFTEYCLLPRQHLTSSIPRIGATSNDPAAEQRRTPAESISALRGLAMPLQRHAAGYAGEQQATEARVGPESGSYGFGSRFYGGPRSVPSLGSFGNLDAPAASPPRGPAERLFARHAQGMGQPPSPVAPRRQLRRPSLHPHPQRLVDVSCSGRSCGSSTGRSVPAGPR
jgi:hypothetical protein